MSIRHHNGWRASSYVQGRGERCGFDFDLTANSSAGAFQGFGWEPYSCPPLSHWDWSSACGDGVPGRSPERSREMITPATMMNARIAAVTMETINERYFLGSEYGIAVSFYCRGQECIPQHPGVLNVPSGHSEPPVRDKHPPPRCSRQGTKHAEVRSTSATEENPWRHARSGRAI